MMKISVKMVNGKTVTLEVDESNIVEVIKYKIEDMEGILPDRQRLIFGCSLLEDCNYLNYYNIQEGSTVDLFYPMKAGFLVFIKHLTGKISALEVGSHYTIRKVKEEIEGKEGIPFYELTLFLAGKQLEDDQTLWYYRITEDSILHLLNSSSGGMCIFVSPMFDKPIPLKVQIWNTIYDVKRMIRGKMGVPCDVQSLSISGASLEDKCTLAGYGIQDQEAINLIFPVNLEMKIFILRQLSKETISLKVASWDTIGSVKEKIRGIKTHGHRLMYDGKPLEDGRTLEGYKIYDGSALYLVPIVSCDVEYIG